MFSVEIKQEGLHAETRLVRRQVIKIGSDAACHVVIPQLANAGYYLQVEKDLGSRFRVVPVGNAGDRKTKVYDLNAVINIDDLEVSITAVDYDLVIRENEIPDKGIVRILKQAAQKNIAEYPALYIKSDQKFSYSLAVGIPVYIGRAEDNDIVLDASDISSRHCRFGYEDGNFWIEDLGSTNGTYLNRQQISGRTLIKPGVGIVLGVKTTLLGIMSARDLEVAMQVKSEALAKPMERKFPVVTSANEIARPARLLIPDNGKIAIGRDPSNEIWLGVPHVSRRHCEISLLQDGSVEIQDCSTNGTGYLGGLLKNGQRFRTKEPHILNFGGDINLGIFFDEEQERRFHKAKGDPEMFDRQGTIQLAGSSRATTTLDRETVETVKGISQAVRDSTLSEQLIIFFSALNPVTKLLFVGVGLALVLLIILIFMVVWSVLR